MKIDKIIIAIDGFSSTGKSSLAKLIAKEYSFLYLDSGAMYRAITLFAQENNLIDENNHIREEELRKELEELHLDFIKVKDSYRIYMNNRDIEDEIRSLKVASQVSPISTLAIVRAFVDEKLRLLAKEKAVVMDGRDIGTTVFPDAEIKLFVTADKEIRAKRRYEEMLFNGLNPNFEDVLKNIQDRDSIDSTREISPLRCSTEAFVLDNSNMTLKEELIWFKGLLQGKFDIKE